MAENIVKQIKLPGSTTTYDVHDSRISESIATTDSGKLLQVNSSGNIEPSTITTTTIGNKADKSEIPTKVSDLTNDAGYTTNTGTVTSVAVKMNDTTKGTVTSSGTIDLGTVITAHQSASAVNGTSVGSATKGVYINSNGKPTAMTYSLNKDVPSDAKFTDTKPNDGSLTLQVAGTTKATFTADDADNVTFNVTADDLGLSQALVFKGITTTDLKDGDTTSPITLDGGGSLTPAVGNVVITKSTVSTWPNTEFVWANSKWNKLGDAKSYALSSVTVTGTGALGGGGSLVANRTITHNTGNAASKAEGLYKISTDAYSHVNSATAVTKADITGLGIPGSDTNQTVKAGSTTFGANDVVEIVAGSNVSVTPDSTNKKITIASTNTNTTYSLTQDSTDGHKITLTPSSGEAQTITIPDNNTTYTAGTGLTLSGTKFNHSNSVTAGTASEGGSARTLAFGGTFNVPSVTYDAQGHVTGKGSTTLTMPANPNTDTNQTVKGNGTTFGADDAINIVPGNNVTVTADATNKTITIAATDTNTHNSHAIISGVKADGTTNIQGSASSGNITMGDSGVTAGEYGPTANQTPAYGATFNVPDIKVNAKGIVTSATNRTVKIPASDNTNQTVKGNGTAFGATTAVDIVPGNNVSVTADTTNNKITIAATDTTYSDATTSAHGLMTAADKTKLNGIAEGATANTGTVTTTGTMTATHVVTSNGGTVIKDSGFTIGKSVPSDAKFTDTTYSSKSASSGGTDVSLVTTGEKYTWNNKSNFSGNYNDLTNKPTIPTVGNGALTVVAGTTASGTFTANQSGASTITIDAVTHSELNTAISAIPTPMQFKGTLGTNGTITTLPTAAASLEGHTYKVITDGTYASTAAKVGDIFVCGKPTSAGAFEWILIPSGDDVEDTWRNIKVNGTQLLGTGISSGAVNFKNGSNVTISGSGNDITISSSYTNTNQTVKGNGTAFGSNDAVDIVAGSNVTVTADATNKKITIAATDTTYSSKTAASGGTDVSLVTTGEKYTWNSKGNGTITGINVDGTSVATSGTASIDTPIGYYTCATAAGTAAKVGTYVRGAKYTSSNLPTGAMALVKFTNSNSASSPTLNLNSSGAKALMQYGTTKISTSSATTGWQAGSVCLFVYDGTNWVRNQGYNTNNTYSSKAAAEGGADTSLVTTGEKYIWNNKSDFSGNYDDLTNKPTIPSAPGTLNTNNTSAQSVSSSEALSGTINLHKVSKTGSYGDLLNKPTIPTITDTYSSTSTNGMSGKAVASAIGALDYTSPTASTTTSTTFIDTVSQTDGKISATKKTLPSASTSASGIVQLNNTTSSTSTSQAATANAVKLAYDHGGVTSVNGSTGAVTITVPTKPDLGTFPWPAPSSFSTVGNHKEATITISGATVNSNSKIDIQPSIEQINTLQSAGCTSCMIVNNNSTVKLCIIGDSPAADDMNKVGDDTVNVQVCVTEVTQ